MRGVGADVAEIRCSLVGRCWGLDLLRVVVGGHRRGHHLDVATMVSTGLVFLPVPIPRRLDRVRVVDLHLAQWVVVVAMSLVRIVALEPGGVTQGDLDIIVRIVSTNGCCGHSVCMVCFFFHPGLALLVKDEPGNSAQSQHSHDAANDGARAATGAQFHGAVVVVDPLVIVEVVDDGSAAEQGVAVAGTGAAPGNKLARVDAAGQARAGCGGVGAQLPFAFLDVEDVDVVEVIIAIRASEYYDL